MLTFEKYTVVRLNNSWKLKAPILDKMDFLTFIYVYLFGGVSLIPLILLVLYSLQPIKKDHGDNEKDTSALKAGEVEENATTGLKAYKTGWLTVTQEYFDSVDSITSNTRSVLESSENRSAYSSLYRLVKNSESDDTNDNITQKPLSEPKGDIQVRKTQKKHRYYAVLKHGNLFLYKSENLKDVKHVIVLANHIVCTWPRNLTEGQLFTKYSAICIMKRDWSRKRRLSDNFRGELITTYDILTHGLAAPPGSIFIYCDRNIEQEDWYFTLIRATKTDEVVNPILDPSLHAKTLHFDTKDMLDLIQRLYSTEGQLYTKWLNGLIGRLFLSLQRTEFLKNLLISRLEKKLEKIKKPGFLDEFKLVKLDPGISAPFITWPSLTEINPDGDITVRFSLHYLGKLSFQISNKVNINLGSHFKPREVDLLLSITIEKIEGQMLLKVKPPPSDRIWYTFESEPIISLSIEPVISSRQITYNIVTGSIERKFKEAIRDSLVLPHWDDFVFYRPNEEIYKGGIWDKSGLSEQNDTENNSEIQEACLDEEASSSCSLLTLESQSGSKKTQAHSKMKLSSTITDISKKIKKQKSVSTLGISEDNCLSDGSFVDSSKAKDNDAMIENGRNKPSTMNTLRRIGKWYFKDEKQIPKESYTPPEMILNRRIKKSVSDAGKSFHDINAPSYEMFNRNSGTNILASRDLGVTATGSFERNTRDSRVSLTSQEKPNLSSSEKRADDIESLISDEQLISAAILDPNDHIHNESIAAELAITSPMSDTRQSSPSRLVPVSPVMPSGTEVPIRSRTLHRKPPAGSPPSSPMFEDDNDASQKEPLSSDSNDAASNTEVSDQFEYDDSARNE